MSRFKSNAKQKQEARSEKKQTGAAAVVSALQGQLQKFANEWALKINKQAAVLEEFFKNTAESFGKVWANQQGIAESVDQIDLNVIALAEMQKIVFENNARLSAILKTLSPEETKVDEEAVVVDGKASFEAAMAKAFGIVNERRAADRKEREAEFHRQVEEQRKAAEAKSEAERAEAALVAAEAEGLSGVSQTGGDGVVLPEGATVFGG